MEQTYTITEKQNVNSTREGYEFSGTLDQAKRKATKEQVAYGTVLTIELSGELVAYKEAAQYSKQRTRWINV